MATGPVCSADDEWVSRKCFVLPVSEEVEVWTGVQKTPQRIPEKQAR